ncbi:DHA2 family efflux MFS transporter permease subunit [Goodfellowiella coeruleoviolacea]|uniref:Drug resistance transporter, EmrB/QacA subfamily n=1 Tax=Goodfellowiella coeruleoviolacea TaxID=334858 RepID=A0AAE3KIL1_9PSEU|nr:DHA2 family efflux MFS transporter permease subunit [Goodfellowiella coeruleoviolacea]MCP2168590.1 drug resistance transporter, EmrB/QacA subfamily [Goodfellowiella coeruleoviolacea]
MSDTRPDTTEPSPPTEFDWPLMRTVLVMVLGGMMAFLDATIVNVGVETLRTEFGAGLDTIQWVATGYLLAVAVVTPLTGWLIDRFGGRRMWLTGLVAFVIGSVLCSLAWSAPVLIAFRVLQGFGGGMLEPIMLALLVRAAGPARVSRLMGLLGAITVGPVLGPLLGGVILANLDWHWLFLINVPIGLAAIALALRYLPADTPATAGGAPRVDVLGIALLCPSSAFLMYGLSRAGDGNGFANTPVLTGLVVGGLFLAAYLVHALRTRTTPLIDPRLFTRWTYTASALGMTVLGVVLFSLLFLIPLYYQEVRDYSPLAVGLLLAPLGVGTLLGNPVAGRYSERLGARVLVPIGGLVIAATAVVFITAGPTTPVAWLVPWTLLAGFGVGFVGAPTMGSLYRTVPGDMVPRATSAAMVLHQLGGAFGVAIVALVLQRNLLTATQESAYGNTFWTLVVAAGLIFLAGLSLPARQRTTPPGTTPPGTTPPGTTAPDATG